MAMHRDRLCVANNAWNGSKGKWEGRLIQYVALRCLQYLPLWLRYWGRNHNWHVLCVGTSIATEGECSKVPP